MELAIRCTADLAALRTRGGRRSIRRVGLAPDAGGTKGVRHPVSPAAVQALIRAVNRDLRSCGCETGAVFCAAALATLPALAPLIGHKGAWSTGLAIGFLYVLVAAALGKVVGILLAERRLQRNLDRLARALDGSGD